MHFHVFRINFLAQGNMAQRRVRDNDLINCPRGRGRQARELLCRYTYIEGSICKIKFKGNRVGFKRLAEVEWNESCLKYISVGPIVFVG